MMDTIRIFKCYKEVTPAVKVGDDLVKGRAVPVKSLGRATISMARKVGLGDKDFVIVSIKKLESSPIDFVKDKFRTGGE